MYPCDPLAVSVREGCRLTGLGRTSIYGAMSAGELSFIKVGKRRLILRESITAWIERLAKQQGADR
jgi:excisionase family DNA binding protein